MQPTHENIDRWLFDYTEGNLTADQEEQLELFLMKHPELELDMDAWEQAKVEPVPLTFEHKEELYKKRHFKLSYALALLVLFVSFSSAYIIQKSDRTSSSSNLSPAKSHVHSSTKHASDKLKHTPIHKKTTHSPSVQVTFSKNPSYSLPVSTPFQESNGYVAQQSPSLEFIIPHLRVANEEIPVQTRNISPSDELLSLTLHPLKGMLVDGYRTHFKNEELSIPTQIDDIDISLGDIDLFKKIDHLLSKDIGLSNNQTYEYAIPNQTNLDLNFSSVGTTSQTRFQAISSVRSMESTLQSKLNNQLSLDGYSRNMRAGFGLQVNYNQFNNGLIQNTNVAAIFSPKIALTRKILIEPAVRFKMGTQNLDQQKLVNNSQAEYETGNINTFNFDSSLAIGRTLWYRDLDAGLTIHTPMFFISAQFSNLFRHNENIYSNNGQTLKAVQQATLIAGTQYISRNEQLIFSPYVLFQHNNYRQELYGGFTFKAGKMQIGGSYSNQGTGSASIGYQGKNFALIGQSSYLSLASLTEKTFAHQLTLRINSSTSKKARRYISL